MKYLMLASFVFWGNISISQQSDVSKKEVENLFKVNFLSPGISYEHATGKFQSFKIEALMKLSVGFGVSSSLGNTSKFYFDPAINAQYRFYYNYKRRKLLNKKTVLNNLNYFSPTYELLFSRRTFGESFFSEEARRLVHIAGFVWGMQRNFQNKFSLDFNAGLGYYFTKETLSLIPGTEIKNPISGLIIITNLHLGFWIK